MKLIVLTEKYGDLGNRLFRFSRLYLSKPNNVVLFDFTFFQYVHLYSPKLFEWFILFKVLSFINNKKLCFIKLFFNNPKYAYQIYAPQENFKSESWTCEYVFDTIKNSNRLLHHIPKGAFFCKQTNSNNNKKNRLKKIFNLKKKYTDSAEKLLSIQKPEAFLVGLHIRRGDYAQFRDGELYFDDNFYLSALKLFKEKSKKNNIEFLLLSNEVINFEHFSEMLPLYFGLQHPGVDQALLAQCDHILGVESTFSAWPAFLYDLPRTILMQQDGKIVLISDKCVNKSFLNHDIILQ